MGKKLSGPRALVACAIVTFLAGSAVFVKAQTRSHDFTARARAFSTDRWTLFATAGDSRLTVRGDGDTDLDCYVYDRYGSLLGKDDDETDYCIVDFWQNRAGNVRVEIKNLGSVYNEYQLRLR